jgi:hypothetical protein
LEEALDLSSDRLLMMIPEKKNASRAYIFVTYTVVTIYGICEVISPAEYFVRLH